MIFYFQANIVPNLSKAYETFINAMEKKKKNAKKTIAKPFTFHEPKVSFFKLEKCRFKRLFRQ